MVLFIFAAWHIFAAEALDIQMTPEEKKQTGIYKLDDTQKAALQQWIDTNYTKKQEVVEAAPITGKNPILSENLMSGKYIRLSDSTLWQIKPEDVPIAQAWITPVEILKTQSSDPFYTIKLTNKLTGTSILARQVDSLPQKAIEKEQSGVMTVQ
jgi:hypothetical protein